MRKNNLLNILRIHDSIKYLGITSLSITICFLPFNVYFPSKNLPLMYITHVLYFILFYVYFMEKIGNPHFFGKIHFLNVDDHKRIKYFNYVLLNSLLAIQVYIYFLLYISWIIIRSLSIDELIRLGYTLLPLFLMNTFYSLLYIVSLLYTRSNTLSLTIIAVIEAGSLYTENPYLSPLYIITHRFDLFIPLTTSLVIMVLYIIAFMRVREGWS